jgi:hypothetical protein
MLRFTQVTRIITLGNENLMWGPGSLVLVQ